jgi:hypothetical protein
MKKLLMITIAGAVALATPALADDDKDKPKKKRGNIFAELGLSKDKLKHINKVLKPVREKSAELRKQKDLPRKERAAKYKEINTERDAILKKCLSEAEFKKYQDLLAKRRADRKKKSKDKDE